MTNGEKYKTTKERSEAFMDWQQEHCTKTNCQLDCPFASTCCRPPAYGQIPNSIYTAYCWLDLESEEEEPLPCPFCGGKVQVIHDTQAIAENAKWLVNCYGCHYEYGADTEAAAISAHNRVARAARKEANDANA